MKRIIILILSMFVVINTATAKNISKQIPQRRPWSMLFYYSRMTDKTLNEVLRFDIGLRKAKLYSAELAYEIAPQNIINRFLSYFYASMSLAMNITYQDDPQGSIYEFNPYFSLGWSQFPWRKYVLTRLSIGEGVSYATKVPDREIRTARHAENAKRFLNYLMFEAAFAMPSHPNFQIVYRIHHRSGCFGLYQSSNSGSTAVGIGFRYFF